MLGIILCLLAPFQASATEDVYKSGDGTEIRIRRAGDSPRPLRADIQSPNQPGFSVVLPLDHANVEGVLRAGPGKLVLHGRRVVDKPLYVFSWVDVSRQLVVDSVAADWASISPDSRYVAYRYAAGSGGCPPGVATGAVLALDIQDSFADIGEGWLPAPGELSRTERGFILYPEELRKEGTYARFEPAETGWLPNGLTRYSLMGGPVWSPESKRIAITESEDTEVRLVIIDVSAGLRHPIIHKIPVPNEPFLNPEYGSAKYPPDARSDYRLTVKSVRFTEDGSGVEVASWPTPKFLEKTIVLPVPPAAGAKQ